VVAVRCGCRIRCRSIDALRVLNIDGIRGIARDRFWGKDIKYLVSYIGV